MKKRFSALIVVILALCLTFDAQSIALKIPEPTTTVSQNPLPSQIKNIDKDQLISLSAKENQPYKSGTQVILEMRKDRNDSGFKTLNQAKSISGQRPCDTGGGIDGIQHFLPQLYNTTHFIFHWTNGSDGGFSTDTVSLEDVNATGTPDYVENFASIFENVWQFEVTQREFLAPPTDETEQNDENKRNPDARYDVFIYHMYYYGYADREQWPDHTSYGYIAVENDFIGLFHEPQLEAMQITAGHEFFHSVQFGYDCKEGYNPDEPYEGSWWMETTSTYMEDEVYPEVNHNYEYLPSWFVWCDGRGLENTDYTHEYGNFIWAKHLSENFGDEIIRKIWEEMNYTDGLEAINNVLLTKNSSMVDEFNSFIVANFFLEEYYTDGTEYRAALVNTTFKGVWLEYEYDAFNASDSTEINNDNVYYDAWMDEWGTDYITLKLNPERPEYEIFFDGLDLTTDYLVKLVTKKGESITENVFTLNDQKDGLFNLPYDAFDNITLIMANIGNTTEWPSWRVVITTTTAPPQPLYDVAIMNVESTTFALPEQTININVTAKNNGTERTETFNVSTWWGESLIETTLVERLPPETEETLNINWTIPGEFNGSAIVWTNATVVENDTNPENNYLEGDILTIGTPVYDIAFNNVAVPKNIIGEGFNMTLTVIISNQGTFTETTNITLYLNETTIGIYPITIPSGTDKGMNLKLCIPLELEMSLYCNYTLKIELSQIPGEEYLENNIFIHEWITITIPGDIDGDKDVDIYDAVKLLVRYGLKEGDLDYDPYSDINGEGKIDIYDAVILCTRYGKKYP